MVPEQQPDGEGRNLGSSDPIDESNKQGADGKSHLVGDESNRWEEQVVNSGFERYDPYNSSDRKELDEHHNVFTRKSHVSVAMRHKESDIELSTSQNRGRLLRRGNSPRGERKEFRDKKRIRRDYEIQGKNHAKRARGSRSPSRSLESLPLKKRSPYSSRSSTSRHSGSKLVKTKLASRSTSPIFSPVEIDRHFYPSPKKGQTNSKGASTYENVTVLTENECEATLDELEEEEMNKNPSEKDENLFQHGKKEMRDSQNVNRTRMSSDEMCMVLKHYGLQYPEKTEKDLPVEVYFGSARAWPWEIIYYRRLKKGSISAENYARRVAQNEEFGIVDKYIRGSSGWFDLNEGDP